MAICVSALFYSLFALTKNSCCICISSIDLFVFLAVFSHKGEQKTELKFEKFGSNPQSRYEVVFVAKRGGDDPMVEMRKTDDRYQWGSDGSTHEITASGQKQTDAWGC
jgi:hypothetical protein